jgi:hypothetical protein
MEFAMRSVFASLSWLTASGRGASFRRPNVCCRTVSLPVKTAARLSSDLSADSFSGDYPQERTEKQIDGYQ